MCIGHWTLTYLYEGSLEITFTVHLTNDYIVHICFFLGGILELIFILIIKNTSQGLGMFSFRIDNLCPKFHIFSPDNYLFSHVCKKKTLKFYFARHIVQSYLTFGGKWFSKKGGNDFSMKYNGSVHCICITWHEPLHRVYQDHTLRQTEHYFPLHYSRLGNCSVDQPGVDLVPRHEQHKLKPRRRTGLGSFDCYS